MGAMDSLRDSSTACSRAALPREALRLGWAHAALLTKDRSDVTMARLDEVEALAKGVSAHVQR